MDNQTSNLRKLSYGLYAIGVMDGQRPTGCIVNTVFQITSQNPIIALSMNRDNYTCQIIRSTGRFSVSILSEQTPREAIQQLGFSSGRDRDKFDGLDWEMLDHLPILREHCCGYLTAQLVSVAETPTHLVILASVTGAKDGVDLPPMTYRYYHQVIKGGAPKNAPSYVAPEPQQGGTGEQWVCSVCGYVHTGPLPEDFRCPICGVEREKFAQKQPQQAAGEQWVCSVCGYVHTGPLPEDFRCPVCGVTREKFVQK